LYGKDKIESVKNHFGVATASRPNGKLIWVHAASVGESLAALTFINHMKKQHPDWSVLLTTITVTSADILTGRITSISNCIHQFVVADNPIWIRKFLDHWRPDAAVFMESEIWPNILQVLQKEKIPTFLVNARLSPQSFRRWSRFDGFFASILSKFTCILAQSAADTERYAHFSPSNTKCMDNLKYSNAILPCDDALLKRFRSICLSSKVLVAASTHEGEEEIVIELHKRLKNHINLVTIIIPRHTTRVKSICDLLKHQGVDFALRSEVTYDSRCHRDTEIFCIDTFGEVGTFFRLADICFVGGSLVPIGGHNIYEPVSLGKPVLHGPYMDNAIEVRNFLSEKQVAFQVKNIDEFFEISLRLFSNPDQLEEISRRAIAICRNDALKQIDEAMEAVFSANPIVIKEKEFG
jgi:3-deoxy-D-manno-octulosonic-acid transferase